MLSPTLLNLGPTCLLQPGCLRGNEKPKVPLEPLINPLVPLLLPLCFPSSYSSFLYPPLTLQTLPEHCPTLAWGLGSQGDRGRSSSAWRPRGGCGAGHLNVLHFKWTISMTPELADLFSPLLSSTFLFTLISRQDFYHREKASPDSGQIKAVVLCM